MVQAYLNRAFCTATSTHMDIDNFGVNLASKNLHGTPGVSQRTSSAVPAPSKVLPQARAALLEVRHRHVRDNILKRLAPLRPVP